MIKPNKGSLFLIALFTTIAMTQPALAASKPAPKPAPTPPKIEMPKLDPKPAPKVTPTPAPAPKPAPIQPPKETPKPTPSPSKPAPAPLPPKIEMPKLDPKPAPKVDPSPAKDIPPSKAPKDTQPVYTPTASPWQVLTSKGLDLASQGVKNLEKQVENPNIQNLLGQGKTLDIGKTLFATGKVETNDKDLAKKTADAIQAAIKNGADLKTLDINILGTASSAGKGVQGLTASALNLATGISRATAEMNAIIAAAKKLGITLTSDNFNLSAKVIPNTNSGQSQLNAQAANVSLFIPTPPAPKDPVKKDPCLTNPSSCKIPDTKKPICTEPQCKDPVVDPCLTNPSSCIKEPVKEVDTCATNPALCPPPVKDTCATNPALCPPPSTPCQLNPDLCKPLTPPVDPTPLTPADVNLLVCVLTGNCDNITPPDITNTQVDNTPQTSKSTPQAPQPSKKPRPS